MSVSKKRWLVLLFACLTNLCLGSVYAWSVFAAPMAEYLGNVTGTAITTADLAIVYTVANSVGPITMISGGWINDRIRTKDGWILTGGIHVWRRNDPFRYGILSWNVDGYIRTARWSWIGNGIWMYDQQLCEILSG